MEFEMVWVDRLVPMYISGIVRRAWLLAVKTSVVIMRRKEYGDIKYVFSIETNLFESVLQSVDESYKRDSNNTMFRYFDKI